MTEVRPTQKEIEDALDRIAMTPDGQTFYIFLQRRLMKLPNPSARGALRANLGERSFASELIGLMARGIAESVNRTSSSARDGSEQPVVIGSARAVDTSRTRGAGRRIGPDTFVPGYDRHPDE